MCVRSTRKHLRQFYCANIKGEGCVFAFCHFNHFTPFQLKNTAI
jgi:hypothetical protein